MTHTSSFYSSIAPRSATHRLVSFCLLALMLAAIGTPALAAGSEVVNINSAESSDLENLPRIGPALAQRIVEFREENGPFEDPSDLILVRGIGEKTFALIEPFVAVGGETTLERKLRTKDVQPKAESGAASNAASSPGTTDR